MELETATLRCSSCGARCEPTRSFCKRCGSAVFVDDAVYSRLRQMPDLEHGGSEVGAAAASTSGSGTARLPIPQAARRAARRTRVQPPPAAAAAGAGCLGSLIRWAVFVGIAYYALNAFGLWPGLRTAADGLLRGDQTALTAFIDRLKGLAGDATGTAADGQPPAPDEGALVTPPRVTNRVAARYPAEAFARGIQGTVVLRVTVEPDGAVSGVDVVRSVDTQFGVDDAAVATVRAWTFEPGRRGDERVRLATTVSVRFATGQPGSAPAAR